MRSLMIVDLLITLALLIGFVRSFGRGRTGNSFLGFGSAFGANVTLLFWFGMWQHSPPVLPAEYWKFLGCAAIAAVSALVALISGWLARGSERVLLVVSGTVLGILSILVATVSIRVS